MLGLSHHLKHPAKGKGDFRWLLIALHEFDLEKNRLTVDTVSFQQEADSTTLTDTTKDTGGNSRWMRKCKEGVLKLEECRDVFSNYICVCIMYRYVLYVCHVWFLDSLISVVHDVASFCTCIHFASLGEDTYSLGRSFPVVEHWRGGIDMFWEWGDWRQYRTSMEWNYLDKVETSSMTAHGGTRAQSQWLY